MASNKRVVLKSLIVVRDGRRGKPPIGKSFEFTAEEIEAIERVNPTAVRASNNEDAEADLSAVIFQSASPGRIPGLAQAGAGKTTAMAGGFDGTVATAQGTAQAGQTSDAAQQTIAQIKEGLPGLDNDALAAALEAERAGAKRSGAISLYEAEVQKRATPPVDDDL